jgi:hypothetical protein
VDENVGAALQKNFDNRKSGYIRNAPGDRRTRASDFGADKRIRNP